MSNLSDSFNQSQLDEIILKIRHKFKDIRHITTSDLANLLQTEGAPPLIIDARSKEEFEISHLHSARNINLKSNTAKVLSKVAKNKIVIIYCSVGYRSSLLARALKKLGFLNVWNLEGSIFAWANEGRKIYHGQQQVSLVHPFDRHWGKCLKEKYHPPTKI